MDLARPSLLKRSLPLLGDIRTWIVLFFLIRMIGITSAPIEVGHSWRQCLTAMIARNFTEISADIRFPRVDMGGAGTGIIGAEFPLLNYLMAGLHWLFGEGSWQGRGIVLVVSSIGIFYFHRLVREVFDKPTAFAASLLLLASAWFEFSRKIMPDTFSVSLVIIALYQAWRYLTTGDRKAVWAYVLFASLGVLSKMPAACLLAVLVVPLVDHRVPSRRRWDIVAASLPVLASIVIWYFLWVPHLLETYGYHLYFPRNLQTGAAELWHERSDGIEKFVFEAFRSFMAFCAFVAGLCICAGTRGWRAWLGGAAISLVFLFFMLKTGSVFAHHSYYILPFVPLMAVVAGFAIARIPPKFRWAVLLLICAESVGNQAYDLFPPARNRFLLGLEAIADHYSPAENLVVVNGGMDPQHMYFLHRRGWSVSDEECRDPERLREWAREGATCLFVIQADPPHDPGLPSIYQDPQVTVIPLVRPQH